MEKRLFLEIKNRLGDLRKSPNGFLVAILTTQNDVGASFWHYQH